MDASYSDASYCDASYCDASYCDASYCDASYNGQQLKQVIMTLVIMDNSYNQV